MRKSLFILATLAIPGGSAVIVHSLLAMNAPHDPTPIERTTLRGVHRPGLPADAPSPRTGSSFAMNRLRVDAAGRLVQVSADAELYDADPGFSYIWSVMVLDPETRDVVFEKRYEDQPFRTAAGEPASTTFDDILEVPLEPGQYPVEVVLHRIPPGLGPESLDFPEAHGPVVGPRGGAVVAIR